MAVKVKRYKYPYDRAGYNVQKYPSSIGLDPDKVKCSNCRHYDEDNNFCLLHRYASSPNNRCWYFGRRGL
jgi:hypothetical protein